VQWVVDFEGQFPGERKDRRRKGTDKKKKKKIHLLDPSEKNFRNRMLRWAIEGGHRKKSGVIKGKSGRNLRSSIPGKKKLPWRRTGFTVGVWGGGGGGWGREGSKSTNKCNLEYFILLLSLTQGVYGFTTGICGISWLFLE